MSKEPKQSNTVYPDSVQGKDPRIQNKDTHSLRMLKIQNHENHHQVEKEMEAELAKFQTQGAETPKKPSNAVASSVLPTNESHNQMQQAR
jgi:hypothetical protein